MTTTTTKTPRFRIQYRKNCGLDPEMITIENAAIVGRYSSADHHNEGFKIWAPCRKSSGDSGYRNLNYYGIVSIEIETGR